MKVFITGGTGFIGSRLVPALLAAGHTPVILTRDPGRARSRLPQGTSLVQGDPSRPGPWQEAVQDADAAVNLVGEPIFGRWSQAKKEAIVSSRVPATRNLVQAVPHGRSPAFVLVSGSAVGYYGYRGHEELTERAGPGTDFLAGVAVEWEGVAREAEERGCRVVLLRSGIVLGRSGGALQQMVRPFRFYGGGPIGSGRQFISWIHIDDEVGLILMALQNDGLSGPLNAVAPNPATNADFARTLGAVMHRPAWMTVPAFTLRLALGEFAETVLHGQRVLPAKALACGYAFLHPQLEEALLSILATPGN